MGNMRDEPKAQKSKTGVDRAGSKWSRVATARGKGSLTWLDADPDLFRAAAAAVTEDGAALLLSKTSDGGALVLKVIQDKETTSMYPASTQDLYSTLELLKQIAETA